MDSQKFATAISVLILAFVGLNILLVFGSFFGFNISDLVGITGAATTKCENTVGGIECQGIFYQLKPFKESCPENTVKVCTNLCEIERAMVKDGRVCPTHCVDYCLTEDVANLLSK